VKSYIYAFVGTLEMCGASLAGLDSLQSSNSVTDNVMRVRNAAAHELGNVLTRAGCTHEELTNKASEIEMRYVKRTVTAHKSDIECSFHGINSLTCISAAVQMGDDVTCILQTHYSAARDICLCPPRHLVEALSSVGLSLTVLSACFAQIGWTGASSLPPSWGRAVYMITEYFSSTEVAECFSKACVAARCAMRSELEEDESSEIWSGVCVEEWNSPRIQAMRNSNRSDLVCELRASPHNSTPTGLVIATTNCAPRALRVVRFVRLLAAAVRLRVLKPRVLRANILLASVARSRSERRFQADRIILNCTQSVAERASIEFLPECKQTKANVHSVVVNPARLMCFNIDSSSLTMPLHPSCMVVTTPSVDGGILLALARDYHIASAFLRCIPRGGGDITLKSISGILTSVGSYFQSSSNRSVEQSVAFVVQKVLTKTKKSSHTDGIIEYRRAGSGSSGGNWVETDITGARALVSCLHSIIYNMRTSDKAFLKEWHVSRSSKNKAKSKAVECALFGVD